MKSVERLKKRKIKVDAQRDSQRFAKIDFSKMTPGCMVFYGKNCEFVVSSIIQGCFLEQVCLQIVEGNARVYRWRHRIQAQDDALGLVVQLPAC